MKGPSGLVRNSLQSRRPTAVMQQSDNPATQSTEKYEHGKNPILHYDGAPM